MDDVYERIVPTAWLVAYRRTFSDIPFSKEIFRELDRLRSKRFFEISDKMLAPELAPQYEARYKIIDKYIAANHSHQILEIAAGFSGRGLAMAENPTITYVEFDLPRVMQDKEKIARNIIKESGKKRHNLYFEKGDALDYTSILPALTHFRKEPVTVVNEGFLRYLSLKEKEIVANNVHKILEQYGGVWITPDITLKKLLDVEKKLKVHNKIIEQMTGVDVDKNRFESENQAMAFFKGCGFDIERHSFLEVKDQLVSPQKLKLSEADVKNLIADAVLYAMRIRT